MSPSSCECSLLRRRARSCSSFVIIATITVSALLLQNAPKQSEHVELTFLSVGKNKKRAPVRTDWKVRVSISTMPAGLLVVHDQDVLGRTPLTADLPLQLEERVVVKLSGPYYETWVTEIKRDVTGDYLINAELIEKD